MCYHGRAVARGGQQNMVARACPGFEPLRAVLSVGARCVEAANEATCCAVGWSPVRGVYRLTTRCASISS
jgi:hypothetical protein